MFNVSFGEISLIVLVAALFFGVEECQAIIKIFRKTQRHAGKYRNQINKEIKKIEGVVEENTEKMVEEVASDAQKIIADLDGNPQVCYSLEDLENKLKHSTVNQSNGGNKHEKS